MAISPQVWVVHIEGTGSVQVIPQGTVLKCHQDQEGGGGELNINLWLLVKKLLPRERPQHYYN